LVEPYADKSARTVDECDLGDGESGPGMLDLDVMHAAYYCSVHAHGDGSHIRHRAQIEIAERVVANQVIYRVDPELGE
jgi:hypothetical protein